MTLLDSNVLIRLATADDKSASEEAASFLSMQPKNSVQIIDAVLVEVCFVLEFHDYKMKRNDICDFLQVVFDFSQVDVAKDQKQTLALYRTHQNLDYTDCILLQQSRSKEVALYTFDKDLQKVCTTL